MNKARIVSEMSIYGLAVTMKSDMPTIKEKEPDIQNNLSQSLFRNFNFLLSIPIFSYPLVVFSQGVSFSISKPTMIIFDIYAENAQKHREVPNSRTYEKKN